MLHKFPFSVRRPYEKLRRFPQGFLVLGDAISSFNPTYGQGMTSAALQAAELDKLLTQGTSLAQMALAFFKAAAKVIDIPWQLAVGEDFRYAETSGPKPVGVDLINKLDLRTSLAEFSRPYWARQIFCTQFTANSHFIRTWTLP